MVDCTNYVLLLSFQSDELIPQSKMQLPNTAVDTDDVDLLKQQVYN